MQSEIENRLRFETLLADICAQFVNIAPIDINSKIGHVQRLVCEFLGLDHSSIWQISDDDPELFVLTHILRDPTLPPVPPRIRARDSFPWVRRMLLEKEVVCLPDVAEAPAEAAKDLETWRQYGIRSTLVFPLSLDSGIPIGAMSFESTSEKRYWPKSLQQRLQFVVYVVANALDRKRAVQQLHESESRLSLAAKSASAGLWTFDVASGAIWTTETAQSVLGLGANELTDYEQYLRLVHPEDRETVRQLIDEAVQSGNELEHEYRIIHPDGSVRWVLSHCRRHFQAINHRPLLMGATFDITDRKRQQKLLRESEERFRRVVEHIGDALFVDDVDGRVVFANDKFLSLFGFTRGELPNVALDNYIAPECIAELRDRHNRRIKGEDVPSHFEYEGRRRDGTRLWLQVDVVPVTDAHGKVIGTQSALRDITQRKQMEEELRRREAQLREAQRIALMGDWTWDPRSDAVTWSDQLVALVGWDATLPIPTLSEHAQFFEAESWKRLNEAIQNTLRTGIPYEVDTEGRHLDGTKGWYTNRGEIVRDRRGAVDHLRGTVQDITQRKLAERALRESEERYRGFVESSNDWVWEVDADCKYTYVGPQCKQILGYVPEEVLGKTPFDLMSPQEASRVAEVFEALAKECKPFKRLENINRHKNGQSVVLETNGVPVLDQQGNFGGYRGMDRDITERKRAEEILLQSERKFVTLFRTTPAAIGLNTLDGKFVDVNQTFEAATGYRHEEAVGRTAENLGLWAHPKDREEIRLRLLKEGRVHDIDHQFRTKSGDLRTGLLSSELIEINDEKYVLTVVKDVTEQKRVEQALRLSEARYRSLVETQSEAVVRSNVAGEVIFANDAYRRTFGNSGENVLGISLSCTVVDEDRPILLAAMSATQKTPYRQDTECRHLTADGVRWFRWSHSGVLNEKGKVVELQGVGRDITPQKIAEHKLRQMSVQLMNAQEEERKRLARELHDDINQRLAMLAIGIQRLEQTQLTALERKNIRKLFVEATAISSDIQALSHELHSASLDILGLAAAIQGFCRELARRRQININFVHRGVPKSVCGDLAQLIFRVAQEALNNAAKHSGAQNIDVDLIGTQDEIHLTICDSGAGFEIEQAMRNGLGLISMRERLTLVNGELSIESQPKRGTTVHARVPLHSDSISAQVTR